MRNKPASCISAGVAGRVVTLKLRTTDFRIVTRRRTLPVATQTARTLFAVGRELLAREADGRPWRLVGIGVADLVGAEAAAQDFFAGEERRAGICRAGVAQKVVSFCIGSLQSFKHRSQRCERRFSGVATQLHSWTHAISFERADAFERVAQSE